MTRKTGNFKKFSVFVNMLWSALKGNTESVFIDLLTLNDLDALRNRRLQSSSSNRKLKTTDDTKRYLILTYAVEFDRYLSRLHCFALSFVVDRWEEFAL
jgi:coiled-coil domain-containing protein 61